MQIPSNIHYILHIKVYLHTEYILNYVSIECCNHRLQSKQKISNKDMLFFDDEWRNVRDLKQEGKTTHICHLDHARVIFNATLFVGVTCVFVKNGISWNYIKQGLDLHKNKLVELNHTSK